MLDAIIRASLAVTQREFSRREREIIDIVYALEHATAQEICRAMRSAPSDAAVRTTLRSLVQKGRARRICRSCGSPAHDMFDG